jgi:hypothetical protein
MTVDFHIAPLNAIGDDSALAGLWREALARQSCDVFYQLDYIRAARHGETGEIYLACRQEPRGMVIYPFVLLEIGPPGNAIGANHRHHDIANIFEYGGPLVITEADAGDAARRELLSHFDAEFNEWCHANHVVSEFIRFHPLHGNQVDCAHIYDAVHKKDHVIIDLTVSDGEILARMSRSCRRNIRKAQRQGYSVGQEAASYADLFAALYDEEMERLDARDSYRFGRDYFRDMARLPGHLGSFDVVRDECGDTVNAMILLHGDTWAHYHLSAKNRRRDDDVSGSELLLFDAACRMKQSGRKYLHLGGAGRAQAGLNDFKSRFSDLRVPAYHASKVRDPHTYRSWRQEAEKAGDPRVSQSFFPFYRAPAHADAVKQA